MEKISKVIRRINEKRWLFLLRRRNNNYDFTLITNNCVGGVIYHNLGIRFQSPTINLYIKGKEYLEFVKNIKEYVRYEIKEITEDGINFPIGILEPENKALVPIRIYFQHYGSFADAKKKWEDRIGRMNFSNLYAIWEFYDNLYDIELLKEFKNLPIKKKIILHREIKGFEDAFIFNEKPVVAGRILEYEGLTGKRKLDRFDYVEFLNK